MRLLEQLAGWVSRRPSAAKKGVPFKAAPSKKPKEVAKWKEIPHKDQIAVLVMARVVEPIVQTSLTAYMFHQLQWFDSSLPDSTIAWQAGVLQASFSGAQTLTSWYWGRAADTYGRKAVLLFGSFGTLISCIGFGLSKSFVSALLFRMLGGLVNGNIPVMRTMVSEIVKEKKYQARAFLLMPMCFNVGVIFGPAMGGILADPAGTYPRVFGPGSTLGGKEGVWWMFKWPYLAPNLFSSVIVIANIFLVSIFLRETLPSALYFREQAYEESVSEEKV
jgi:MFS family permease